MQKFAEIVLTIMICRSSCIPGSLIECEVPIAVWHSCACVHASGFVRMCACIILMMHQQSYKSWHTGFSYELLHWSVNSLSITNSESVINVVIVVSIFCLPPFWSSLSMSQPTKYVSCQEKVDQESKEEKQRKKGKGLHKMRVFIHI